MLEWEHGLQSWHDNADRSDHTLHSINNRLSMGISQPSSSECSTIFEGGPDDALQALNGRPRASSDTSEGSIAPETQVLEGIARTDVKKLNQEDRLAKMKDAQKTHQIARENAMVTASFVRELEVMIKRRPQRVAQE